MIYAPTGSCVSSPTTSLPYVIPGDLNWDERYVMLSDATSAAAALKRCGYDDEADALTAWLDNAASRSLRDGELRQDFAVDGGRPPVLRTLDWLEGYEGCRPVRHGSAAQHVPVAQVDTVVAGVVVEGIRIGAANGVAGLMRALVDREVVRAHAGIGAMSAIAEARLVSLGVLRGHDFALSPDGESANGRPATRHQSRTLTDHRFLRAAFPLVEEFRDRGRPAEAIRLFEHLLRYAGSLGLLPSEADPYTGRALGNHPHAAMHAAVIEAAYCLKDL
jgi:GH15 family glucan-1,4-alpha-glucosidase